MTAPVGAEDNPQTIIRIKVRISNLGLRSNKYLNDQVVQVRTAEKLTAREKVTNIRDSEGNTIWNEINYISLSKFCGTRLKHNITYS